MVDQLTTTAAVKARLSIADATDDQLISDLIDGVSDWIADFTQRQLVPQAGVTYVVDTAFGSIIDAPMGVRLVSSLSIAATDQPDTGGVYTAVAAADILLRPLPINRRPGWPATQIVLRGTSPRLFAALNGATFTADVGFAAPILPRVSQAALDAVCAAYTVRRRGASGVLGVDDDQAVDWGAYFGPGSPHLSTLRRLRGPRGIA